MWRLLEMCKKLLSLLFRFLIPLWEHLTGVSWGGKSASSGKYCAEWVSISGGVKLLSSALWGSGRLIPSDVMVEGAPGTLNPGHAHQYSIWPGLSSWLQSVCTCCSKWYTSVSSDGEGKAGKGPANLSNLTKVHSKAVHTGFNRNIFLTSACKGNGVVIVS